MSKISVQEKEETRNRIKVVGMKMFLAKGYDNVSIRGIAKEANIGASTIYGYFETKLDLFLDVFLSNMSKKTEIKSIIEPKLNELLNLEMVTQLFCEIVIGQLSEALKIGKSNLRQIYKSVLTGDAKGMFHSYSNEFGMGNEIPVKILQVAKEQGNLLVDFDTKELISFIRFVAVENVMVFLNDDDMHIEQLKTHLNNQLYLLLLGKIKK